MDIVTLLVTSLITAGGLGYANYFILSRLNVLTVYESSKDDKKLIMLFFSLLNYWLYLVCYSLVKHVFNSILIINIISIALTFIVTVWLSIYILPKIMDKMKDKLNEVRRGSGKNDTFSETVHDGYFNEYNENKPTYVYDLQGKLIFKGYSYRWSNSKEKELEFLAVPFNSETPNESYDEMIESIEKNQTEVDIIVNIDKNIKTIIFL